MILWEIETEEVPFSACVEDSEVKQIVCDQNLRPQIPETDPRLSKLIRTCWHRRPENRPSIDQIYLQIQSVTFSSAHQIDLEDDKAPGLHVFPYLGSNYKSSQRSGHRKSS